MFKKIVLNIPHSSPDGADFVPYSDNEALRQLVNHWTDWFTDELFAPDAALAPYVAVNKFHFSRFLVDVERLVDDPLEKVGQGILYTNYEYLTREINERDRRLLTALYHQYISSFKLEPDTILVDCHSFPSEMAPDIDICTGYNNDYSYPGEAVIAKIESTFANAGYRVGINTPYSNALTPSPGTHYKSVMIEVNKAAYMDETAIMPIPDKFKAVRTCILSVYQNLLGK